MIDQPRVCAVVVTYNPELALRENIQALRQQIDQVVVVDNASGPASRSIVDSLAGLPGIQVLANPTNGGLAAALNQGVRSALAQGYEWIATFDQDSRISPGFFATMFAAYNAAGKDDRIAILAPHHLVKTSMRRQPPTPAQATRERNVVMTSGNLVSARVFGAAGFFLEPLFIDYVDYEFCLRLRARGYRILEVFDAHLIHELGQRHQRQWLGFSWEFLEHAPLRHYYITRNRLWLYGRYGWRFPGWLLHDAAWFGLDLIKVLLFEDQKALTLNYIKRGICDVLRHRLGPIDPAP